MRKFIFIAIGTGILIGIGGATYFFYVRPTKSVQTLSKITPSPTPEPLLTWNDPAGFTFQYPQGLSINKHDEDQDNYAHVELTKAGESGSVIVWAKDPPILSGGGAATDAADWLLSDTTLRGATFIDTSLGGEAAKKVLVSSQRKSLVGTVSDDTLWIVETSLGEGDFWQKTADTIIRSFAFVPASSSGTSTDTGSGGGTSVDEEEVVQ